MRTAFSAVVVVFLWTPSPAQIATFPYDEHFDQSATLPAGWEATGFVMSTSSPRSAPNCLSATGNFQIRRLISPLIDLTARSLKRITFAERRSSSAIRFRISLSAISDDSSIVLPLARWDTITTTTSYVVRSVDTGLGRLGGRPDIRFVLEVLRDSLNSTGVLRLDDVQITAEAGTDLSITAAQVLPHPATNSSEITLRASWRAGGLDAGDRADISASIVRTGTSGIFRQVQFHLGPWSGGDSGTSSIAIGRLPAGRYKALVTIAAPKDENPANDTLSVSWDIGLDRESLIINEIMYAPSRTDEPEWVEIFNPGADTLDLAVLTISDNGDTRSTVSTSPALLPPRELAVIAKTAEIHGIYLPDPPRVLVANFASLSNSTSDAVVIRDLTGRMIDSVRYEPSWAAVPGRSLERRDADLPSISSSTWASSRDTLGGTPGRKNSVQRLAVDLSVRRLRVQPIPGAGREVEIEVTVINEGRLAPPSAFIHIKVDTSERGQSVEIFAQHFIAPVWGDSIMFTWRWEPVTRGALHFSAIVECPDDKHRENDSAFAVMEIGHDIGAVAITEVMFDPAPGQNEWIEIFNCTTSPVDIAGWTVSDRPTASGSMTRVTIPGSRVIVLPGQYAVLAAETTVVPRYPWLSGPDAAAVVSVNRSSGLGLNADGDAVLLRDRTGVTVDSIMYEAVWHIRGIGDTQGRSLERLDARVSGTLRTNWSTSTDPMGATPGRRNSSTAVHTSPNGTVSISPNPFSPDGDGVEETTVISYTLDAPAAFVTAQVFDSEGRMVQTLCDNALLSGAGSVGWDGRLSNGRRAPMGIYILRFEARGSVGESVLQKKAVIAVAR